MTYLPGEMGHHAGDCNKISLKSVILQTPQENAFFAMGEAQFQLAEIIPCLQV